MFTRKADSNGSDGAVVELCKRTCKGSDEVHASLLAHFDVFRFKNSIFEVRNSICATAHSCTSTTLCRRWRNYA